MLNIPAPTAVKVLHKLSAAGLTHTKEGAKGGNLLARPIAEMTVRDVFNAVEPNRPLFRVHQGIAVEADGYDDLDTLINNGVQCLVAAERAMEESLASVSLADLIP